MKNFTLKPIGLTEVKRLVAIKSNTVIDVYEDQLQELFFIRNPQFRFNPDYKNLLSEFITAETGDKDLTVCGNWFYFDWSHTLVHLLEEDSFFELRTARNKNLITTEEQQNFYNATVAVAGLSVGSHGALTIVMTGGAKNIKLADFDVISVSNLNRLRYGSDNLGQTKTMIAARQILAMNPYAQVFVYPQGVTTDQCQEFLAGSELSPRADILLEGVDNLEMKILLRQTAYNAKIPVIMATDNGDGIIVDVERYDLEPQPKLFNGTLGNISLETFRSFNPSDLPKLATQVAGPDYIVPRMLASLMQVGNTLYSWPQLGTAASFTGVVAAYLTRAILNKKKISSGKYDINLERIFDQDCADTSTYKRQQEDYLRQMGLI